MNFINRFLYLILFTILCFNAFSQTKLKEPLTRILFILDASNSMNGDWQSDNKINIASKLLTATLDSLQYVDNLELALRVYGHQKFYKQGQDCDDTKLEVPFGKNNATAIKNTLKTIKPKGTTPIAQTLEKSGKDFPYCPDCRNIIILITDGIEECNGDPCAVSLALQKKGIVLKPFVIGIGLDVQFKKTFECVGNYYDAANEVTFKNVLNIVISQALNSTTAQVNLLDIYGNPTETNANMTFYDSFSGAIKYNYIHTINHRGNPDTLPIDPLSTYNLVVHTIPISTKDSITFNAGKHNIIALDAPQGYLQLKAAGKEFNNLLAIVRKSGEMQTLTIQSFKETGKYIVGKYDIEVLTLPRIYINNIEISQSHTTTVEIPQPGIATIQMTSPGYGGIFLIDDNKMKWICNLNENLTSETITLQPGNYKAVYRSKGAKESIYTLERTFKITSGISTSVKFY